MLRRSWLWSLSLACGGMFLVAAAHVFSRQQELPPLEPPAPPARGGFDANLAATGLVEAETENIGVDAALSGVVLEVYVDDAQVGSRVAQGAPLFRVDDRHVLAELRLAEARVAAAEARRNKLRQQPRPEELPPSEARVRALRATVDRLRDDFDRAEALARGGVVTEQERTTRRLSLEAATHEWQQAEAEHALLLAGAWQPDLEIAEAAVAEARAEAERIRTEIERATVRAPVDGVVLQVNVRPGEHVDARRDEPLVVLGGVDRLHVRVDVDEHDIARFDPAARAMAQPRGEATTTYALRFARLEPLVVAKRSLTGDNTERIDTRVLQVIYQVESADASLFVGQQVDVFIDASGPAGAMKGTTGRAGDTPAVSGSPRGG